MFFHTFKGKIFTIIIILSAGILSVIIQHSAIRDLFYVSSDFSYQDEFHDGGKNCLATAIKVEGTPLFSNEGLFLNPGNRVRLIYQFQKPIRANILIKLSFQAGKYLENTIVIGTPPKTISIQNNSFSPSISYSIQKELDGDRELSVILEASASTLAQNPLKVLDLFSINIAPRCLSPVAEIFFMATICLCLFFSLRLVQLSKIYSWITVGLVFCFIQVKIYFWAEEPFSLLWPSFLVIIGCWILVLSRRTERDIRYACILTLLFLVSLGLYYRMQLLQIHKNMPLAPDGITYFNIARQKGALYQTDIREPAYIWLLKIYYLFVPARPENIRILSIFLSLVSFPLVYGLASRLIHPLAGLGAVLLLATSQNFMCQNLRGLRLELLVLTLLAIILLLLDEKGVRTLPRSFALGILITVSLLNTLGLLAPLFLMMVYFLVRKRLTMKCALISLALAALFSLPHFLHNQKTFGDPFFSTNIHAKYYRNMEFMGQSGFPTYEEVSVNSYCGENISTIQYIFQLHSWDVILSRTFRGFVMTYVTDTLQERFLDDNKFLFWIYILGLIIFIVKKRFDFLVCLVLLNLPFYFLNGTPALEFDFRLLIHAQPLVAIILASGFVEAPLSFLPGKKGQLPQIILPVL